MKIKLLRKLIGEAAGNKGDVVDVERAEHAKHLIKIGWAEKVKETKAKSKQE